jgi:hypothetical protein
MNSETERRLVALTDRDMYNSDAQYHAEVAMLRQWLRMMELAMEDEGIEDDRAQRVLHRMVFAVPSGADGYGRRESLRRAIDSLSRTTTRMYH